MAVLVFDSAPMSAFARARQLGLLDALTASDDRVTTQAVLDELRLGVRDFPDLAEALTLPWLRVERLDSLGELRLFAEYARRFGSGQHDLGEATVLAWAEAHGAVAFTDDETAVQVGRDRGVRVQRTLAVVARGVRNGILDETRADRLVEELLRAGARFPFGPGEFLVWARAQGLL